MNLKTILHLTVDGSQYWRKNSGQWLAVDSPDKGSVWVVSDLPEESLTEIQIPRLYGRDRTNFIDRQLASRFPDTPYRAMLPAAAPSGFLDRLAPRRQSLLALDARERVDNALGEVRGAIAGLWTTSGLLARLGADKSLPPDLFLVMPNAQSMRIVFLKNRVPIISRLVRDSGDSTSLVAEIVRTLRHLENTKVVDRDGGQRPVLLLSQGTEIAGQLEAEQLTVIQAPSSWRKRAAADFKFALFDQAMSSPPGQLAPLTQRTGFIAAKMRVTAYALAVAAACTSIWFLADGFGKMQADRALLITTRDGAQQISLALAKTDRDIAAYPVSGDLLKSTLQIEQNEIRAAPSMEAQLQLLSTVIADPSLRLSRLDWAVNTPPTPPCQSDPASTQAPDVPAAPPDAGAAPRGLGSRISFDLSLPAGLEGKARLALIEGVSQRLTKIPGASLQQDPAKVVLGAPLAGGVRKSTSAEATTVSWCFVMAGSTVGKVAATPNKP